MAEKQDFAPVEWRKVIQSPLLAGYAVSAADPSGFIGLLQEAFAALGMVAAGRAQTGEQLIRHVCDALGSSSGRAEAREGVRSIIQGAGLDEIKQRALAGLEEVAAILDAKAGAHALPFKSWLMAVARQVAEAGLEDTFLGFGGIRMSEKEKATLHEIAAALGLPEPAAAEI
jgi:hypothetical protein